MKQKLVFFFPWHEVSGGPYYLTRLANSIIKMGKYMHLCHFSGMKQHVTIWKSKSLKTEMEMRNNPTACTSKQLLI